MTSDFDHDTTARSRVAHVLAPVAVDTAYSYRIPAGLNLGLGQFVEIPLGRSHTTGVVWGLDGEASGGNLKAIAKLRDWPPLRRPLRDFIDWVSCWTLSPRGMVLRMAIRAPDAAG